MGDLHPRRNVGLLIDAVAWLRAHHAGLASVTLTLVGRDAGDAAPLRARARAAGLETDAVRFVDDADDQALIEWYRRAAVFAYPSRYEGFGLPVLEAMACGVPVIASTAASLPEVVGNAGLLADPLDVRAWTERSPRCCVPRRAAARDAGIGAPRGFLDEYGGAYARRLSCRAGRASSAMKTGRT